MLVGLLGRTAIVGETNPTIIKARSIFDPRVRDKLNVPLENPVQTCVTFSQLQPRNSFSNACNIRWGSDGAANIITLQNVYAGLIIPLYGSWFEVGFQDTLTQPVTASISEGRPSRSPVLKAINSASIAPGVTTAIPFLTPDPFGELYQFFGEVLVTCDDPTVPFRVFISPPVTRDVVIVPAGTIMDWRLASSIRGSVSVKNDDPVTTANFFVHVRMTL